MSAKAIFSDFRFCDHAPANRPGVEIQPHSVAVGSEEREKCQTTRVPRPGRYPMVETSAGLCRSDDGSQQDEAAAVSDAIGRTGCKAIGLWCDVTEEGEPRRNCSGRPARVRQDRRSRQPHAEDGRPSLRRAMCDLEWTSS
jgi:hypothetical protein